MKTGSWHFVKNSNQNLPYHILSVTKFLSVTKLMSVTKFTGHFFPRDTKVQALPDTKTYIQKVVYQNLWGGRRVLGIFYRLRKPEFILHKLVGHKISGTYFYVGHKILQDIFFLRESNLDLWTLWGTRIASPDINSRSRF